MINIPITHLRYPNKAIYVQPRTSYLAIVENTLIHTFLQEIDILNFQEKSGYLLCEPSNVFQKGETCESLLLTQECLDIPNLCDINIINNFTNYWKKMKSMNGWIFSLSQPQNLQITCINKTKQNLTLKFIGILELGRRV